VSLRWEVTVQSVYLSVGQSVSQSISYNQSVKPLIKKKEKNVFRETVYQSVLPKLLKTLGF